MFTYVPNTYQGTGMIQIVHKDSLTHKTMQCWRKGTVTATEPLKIPSHSVLAAEPGAAFYSVTSYGRSALIEAADAKDAGQISADTYKKVLVNAWTARANGAEATQYGATVEMLVVGTAGGTAVARKRARIANYRPGDAMSSPASIPLIISGAVGDAEYPPPWHGLKIRQYTDNFDDTTHDYASFVYANPSSPTTAEKD